MKFTKLFTLMTASAIFLTGCQYYSTSAADKELEALNEEYGIYKGGPDIFGSVVDKDNVTSSRTVMVPTTNGGMAPMQRSTTDYYLYVIREGEDDIREYEVSKEDYRKCNTDEYFYRSGQYETITCHTEPIVGSKTYFGEYDEDGNPVADEVTDDEQSHDAEPEAVEAE